MTELTALSIDAGEMTPRFSGWRRVFSAHVPQQTASLTLTGEAAADVLIAGVARGKGAFSVTCPLLHGANPIVIEVDDGDGKPVSYCLSVIRAHPAPNWQCVAVDRPFAPRDSSGELVFDGRMWLFGGYTPKVIGDVWSSADGVEWVRAGDLPDVVNIPMRWVHRERMWLTTTSGCLLSSGDGQNWQQVSDDGPVAGRHGAGSAVFDGRMWLLGGARGGDLLNDVWSSVDGVTWQQVCAAAPWSRRMLWDSVVVQHGKLWLIGGGVQCYHPFSSCPDVWCSADGANWELVTDEAAWPLRTWFSCAAYADRLWLFGGFRSQPDWRNFNDVWYSDDGVDWRQLLTPSIWSPRHEISPYVFDQALWLVAGNAWPLANDVWRLQLDGLTFLSQPVTTVIRGAEYRYRPMADFGRHGVAPRYQLASGPAWLRLDESGVLRGQCECEGISEVVLTASDGDQTAAQRFAVHVVSL